MEKPISVAYEEFKYELAGLINNSGLPAFVVELILRDCLNEIKTIRERQYEAEKAQYEESLKKEAEQEEVA